MRITFLVPTAGMAGGNRVIAIYAGHLIQRGHFVEVISQPPAKPTLYDRLNGLLFRGSWTGVAETAPYFKDLNVPLRVIERRRPVVNDDAPDADIVIATWWETAECVAELSAKKGAEPISPTLPLPAWLDYHHLPAQDQLRKLYSQCDVWLCGSRSEGFHLPPLEAMACRCAVVSTRVGGPLDTVRDGINGFLADVDDEVGLSEGLIKVLRQNESEWERMSAAALATATCYTWEDAAILFEQALKDITQGYE